MKFRDGMWLVAEGVRPEYAEEVYSISQREDGKALSLSTLTIVCITPLIAPSANFGRTLQRRLMESSQSRLHTG